MSPKIKAVCKQCGYWNPEARSKCKCYCGDCPAKLRDDSNKRVERRKSLQILLKSM